jgi:ABC-type thiamine transport system substrate-binding protein
VDLAKEMVMLQPKQVLALILKNPTDLAHVRSLVTDDVSYVSLNYDNPDLRRIMP